MKQRKLSTEDCSTLCLSLSQQLSAGMGLGDALSFLAEDASDPRDKALFAAMAQNADKGMPLPEVFRSAGCFPHYLCSLLDAGSRVGKTDEALAALARHYDSRRRLEQQIRSAILYPTLLAAVMLVVVVVLLVWVLPVFHDVYALLGSSLTGLAGGLLLMGTALGKALPVLGALAVLFAVLFAIAPLRRKFAALWRRCRADRGVARKINAARFVQTLSMGISSGMTSQDAVALALHLTETSPFRKRCEACLSHVENGDTLPSALRKTDLLPKPACRLLDAGLRSGCGEAVLETIAQQRLEDSETALEHSVSRIEPTLVLVTSLLVGAILLAVMLPLMNIMTGIG